MINTLGSLPRESVTQALTQKAPVFVDTTAKASALPASSAQAQPIKPVSKTNAGQPAQQQTQRTTKAPVVEHSSAPALNDHIDRSYENDSAVTFTRSGSVAGSAEENAPFAHQHHVALDAYKKYGLSDQEESAVGQDPAQKLKDEQDAERKEALGIKDPNDDPLKEKIGQDPAKQAADELTQSPADKKAKEKEEAEGKDAASPAKKDAHGQELSERDLAQIEHMKDRDQEVRIHEQAHKRAGGQYAGNPSYSYETGPDGKRYIVDGEVSIDMSAEKTPEATIAKMEIVKRAALAPATPSGQDRHVYSTASQKQAEARQELAEQASDEVHDKIKEQQDQKTDDPASSKTTSSKESDAQKSTSFTREKPESAHDLDDRNDKATDNSLTPEAQQTLSHQHEDPSAPLD